MISFKQFLIEAANYPLYHGTTLPSLVSMLEDNRIDEPGYSDAMRSHHHSLQGKHTISLTRSKNFAAYWSRRKEWASSWDDSATPPTVVIELNRGKLTNHYKLVPYNHFPDRGARQTSSRRFDVGKNPDKNAHQYLDFNQYEERVVGPIKNLNKYIAAVYLTAPSEARLKKDHPHEYEILVKNDWLKKI